MNHSPLLRGWPDQDIRDLDVLGQLQDVLDVSSHVLGLKGIQAAVHLVCRLLGVLGHLCKLSLHYARTEGGHPNVAPKISQLKQIWGLQKVHKM